MKKILVCDDSTFTRNRVINMISKNNLEILEAGNGREALDSIEKNNPDLVILDLLMPEITGQEVLKQLKQSGNSTPVIVLSADIQEMTQKQCLELGAKHFLNKPPNEEQLNEVISSIISE